MTVTSEYPGAEKPAIVLFGATSGIARAVAEVLARRGEALILTGRSLPALETIADALARLGARGPAGRAAPACLAWDVLAMETHPARFRELLALGPVGGLFFAPGILFRHEECRADPAKTRLLFDTNLTGAVLIIDLFAAHLEGRGGGFLSVLSSVAGERPRGSVPAYAASKAGLTAYLRALRHRLRASGVLVQTVHPGFVRTRMTVGFRSRLMAPPETAARDIVRAIDARRMMLYTPWFWRWIMLAIRLLPEAVYRRLRF